MAARTRRHATVALAVAFGVAACGHVQPPSAVPSATSSPPIPERKTASPAPDNSPGPPASASRSVRISRSPIHLPTGLSRAVALVFGSSIIVCGGLTSTGATTDSIIRLDTLAASVTSVGRLRVAVHDAGGAVLGKAGFVVGGGRLVAGSVVERIDPTGAASTVGNLPAVRADLSAVAVGGRLLVVGGGTPTATDDQVLASTDGKAFTIVARLIRAVRYPATVAIGGALFVIGGMTPSGDSRAIQEVDPSAKTVRIVGQMPIPLSHAAAFVLDGMVYIAGGRSLGQAQDSLWRLDVATGVVTNAGRLPYVVSDTAPAVVDGVAYLIGGEGRRSISSVIAVTPG